MIFYYETYELARTGQAEDCFPTSTGDFSGVPSPVFQEASEKASFIPMGFPTVSIIFRSLPSYQIRQP